MKAKKKSKEFESKYTHTRTGDIVKIEIRDFTRRIIYRKRFNVKDKNAIMQVLSVLEGYSGYSIAGLIREKLKIGDWF